MTFSTWTQAYASFLYTMEFSLAMPLIVSIGCFLLLLCFWVPFFLINLPGPFYFDPQDSFRAIPKNPKLPASAENGTFAPLLGHYIDVVKLLVTVAAASIAFGGDKGLKSSELIIAAKLVLAWSVFYGVMFCALLIYRYDEYAQDIKSYTIYWYSTIFALGFASLVCFVAGYFFWALGLAKA
jgi:hypothetical protein